MKLDNALNEGKEKLRASGRVDLADSLDRYRGPALDAMKNTPRPDGMSFPDWKQLVLKNMTANMEATDNQ